MAKRVVAQTVGAIAGTVDSSIRSGSCPPRRRRGVRVALAETDYAEWCASGAKRLWSLDNLRGLAANDKLDLESRLDAEIGYGFSVFDGRGVAIPHAGWSQLGEVET